MPSGPRRIYWDACVFLSYINAIADRLPLIDALLEQGRQRFADVEILTSELSIVEVAYGLSEQLGATAAIPPPTAIDALWNDPTIHLAEFHILIARDARQLIREAKMRDWSLQAADAIHLATASRMGAVEFHTYDDRLPKYSDIVPFSIHPPRLDDFQPTLLQPPV
ncbi:MAG: PIN domain-containing protein [Chloroflexi bacterium]|nr:PIN domain-containing protein [Chloroflexota bacterium]